MSKKMIQISLNDPDVDAINEFLNMVGGCNDCCTMLGGVAPVKFGDTELHERITLDMIEKVKDPDISEIDKAAADITDRTFMLICEDHHKVFREEQKTDE